MTDSATEVVFTVFVITVIQFESLLTALPFKEHIKFHPLNFIPFLKSPTNTKLGDSL